MSVHNTSRERIRAYSLVVNLAFSKVYGLYEEYINQWETENYRGNDHVGNMS